MIMPIIDQAHSLPFNDQELTTHTIAVGALHHIVYSLTLTLSFLYQYYSRWLLLMQPIPIYLLEPKVCRRVYLTLLELTPLLCVFLLQF
jgi:hypothetical protein